MAISIQLSDFVPERLVCLAGAFKHHYQDRENVTILIFSSFDAAKRYLPIQPDYLLAKGARQQKFQSHAWWVSQLHATYFYSADKRQEYIIIKPLGSEGERPEEPYDTRIDLPVATTPHCRLEISSRCLLALEAIHYPGDALKAKASGTVTLAGKFARDGKLAGIQVAVANGNPADKTELLTKSALQNLKTWRLEKAQHPDAFRITFSYGIDSSLPHRGEVDVKLALPNQVSIRGNPPE